MPNKNRKKIIFLILTSTATVVCMFIVFLLFYYVFLFHTQTPLPYFTPYNTDFFISIEDPKKCFKTFMEYLPSETQDELFSRIDRNTFDKIVFLIGDTFALVKRGAEFGIISKITFTGKLLLFLPRAFMPVSMEEVEIAGNTIQQISFQDTTCYLSSRRDVVSIAFSKTLAGDLAELLNRFPVIKPLEMDDTFFKVTRDNPKGSIIFFKNNIQMRNNFLVHEWDKLQAAGGTFFITKDTINIDLRLLGDFPKTPFSVFPEIKESLLTITFPCNLRQMWLDYCFAIQSDKSKYDSFRVCLTSEIFDSVIEAMEPRITLYAVHDDPAIPFPSAIFGLQGNKIFSEKKLKDLFADFINKTQDLNADRVKRYNANKITYQQHMTQVMETNIHYLTIEPSFLPNFSPGFCMINDSILFATSHRDIERILKEIVPAGKDNIPYHYYLKSTDPGLQKILTSLKKSMSIPDNITRIGEALYSKRIELLNTIEKFAVHIASIEIKDNKKPGLEKLHITIIRSEGQ